MTVFPSIPISSQHSWILRFTRLLALGFMLFCLGIFMVGIFAYPQYASQHPERFTSYSWTIQEMEQVLGRAGLSMMDWIWIQFLTSVVTGLIFSGLGFFIFFRKKNDLFVIYIASVFVLYGTQSGYSTIEFIRIDSGWRDFLNGLGVAAWPALFLLFYIFPNGRFVPSWTRWAAFVLIGLFGVDIVIYGGAQPPDVALIPMMSVIAIGIGSQVYRYVKVSTGTEKQQTKWVVFSVLALFAVLLVSIAPLISPKLIDPGSPTALFFVLLSSSSVLFISLFPISIAFAILRYRLWDVDLIIRRTLVYGGLTLTLAIIYFAGVVILQSIFQTITGLAQSPIAIVISTLLIAALFNPLRRRIQTDIDKRFFRKKYDAVQAIERFTTTARQQADLEQIRAELLKVVTETMQPASVSLWMKPSANERHPSKLISEVGNKG